MLKYVFAAVALFSVSLYSDSLENLLFTVQVDGKETGSAFLLCESGTVWMVSNCHVVRKGGKIGFTGLHDESRVYELPESIEVAANRDAVRFKVDEEKGFPLSGTSAFDEAVFAFGNSGGLGVITKSEGKIVGKGRGEIEVTCEIIPGNSGGPVINTRNEVIGIATFGVTVAGVKTAAELSGTVSAAERERLAEKIKDRYGTRYTEARRFAVPLHDAKWQTVERELFREESGCYEKLDERYRRFNDAVTTVFRCRSISMDNENIFPRGWVKNYNQNLSEYGYYDSDSGRYYVRSGRRETFDRAFGRWMQNLGSTAALMAQDFRKQAETMSVLYFQNEAVQQADRLDVKSRDLLEVAEKYKH